MTIRDKKPSHHFVYSKHPSGFIEFDICEQAIMWGMDGSKFKHWMRPIEWADFGDCTAHFYVAKRFYQIHPVYLLQRLQSWARDVQLKFLIWRVGAK